MACIVDGNTIVLTGTVGGYYWDEDGFSAADVYIALRQIGHEANVTLRVNSGGGAAAEGAAIHSMLSLHGGDIDVIIEGWAASAASLLVMAAKSIAMMPGAIMMIHDPGQITIGDAADHERTIRELNTLGDAYAEIYAARTGKPAAEMRAVMKAETWLTGQEAVDAGFADTVGVAANDNPEPVAYAIQSYSKVPQQIVALADARGWKPRATAAKSAANPGPKEITMTDKERADALAAELAALKATMSTAPATAAEDAVKKDRERRAAIMALDEAKGREKLAETLYATTMTVEDIKVALASAPAAAAEGADDYEANRAAGAGLKGAKPPVAATTQAAATASAVANMKKLLGMKENA